MFGIKQFEHNPEASVEEKFNALLDCLRGVISKHSIKAIPRAGHQAKLLYVQFE